jgi:hypothetical protein
MSRDLFRPIDYHRLSHRCGGSTEDAMRAVVETVEGLYRVDRGSPWFPRCADRPGLGDMVAAILSAVGISKDRAQAVAQAVGLEDCGCAERQRQLNELGQKLGIGTPPPDSPPPDSPPPAAQ